MNLLGKIIIHFVANSLGIFLANRLIAGFTVTGTLEDLLVTAGILTAINILIRPILKLIFTPLVIITLGLFTIIINAVMLYILDIISEPLAIESVLVLILSATLISAVNIIVGASGKRRA